MTWKSYQNTFEDHPKYKEEWGAFYKRRHTQLKAEGKDPAKYNFISEWTDLWTLTRIKEIKEAEFKALEEEVLKAHGYSSFPQQPRRPVKPVQPLPEKKGEPVVELDSDRHRPQAKVSLAEKLKRSGAISVPLVPEGIEEEPASSSSKSQGKPSNACNLLEFFYIVGACSCQGLQLGDFHSCQSSFVPTPPCKPYTHLQCLLCIL
jgi:hypothetical protein